MWPSKMPSLPSPISRPPVLRAAPAAGPPPVSPPPGAISGVLRRQQRARRGAPIAAPLPENLDRCRSASIAAARQQGAPDRRPIMLPWTLLMNPPPNTPQPTTQDCVGRIPRQRPTPHSTRSWCTLRLSPTGNERGGETRRGKKLHRIFY